MVLSNCLNCDEPILSSEPCHSTPHLGVDGVWQIRYHHHECFMRMMTGGVNHLRGSCTCCGGTEPPDPPELTKREAARAAVAEWHRKRAFECRS